MVAPGDVVRIRETADGSGSLAPGRRAVVHSVLERCWGGDVIVVTVEGEPTDEMKRLGMERLDLYPDEWEKV